MDFEEVFKALDAAIFAKTQRRLKDVERFVLLGAYLVQTSEEMAKAYDYRYTPSYLKQDVGPKLWKLLSEVLGEAVSKTNFCSAIERQTQLQEVQKHQQTLKLYEAEYGERLKLAGETLYQNCLSPSSHKQAEEIVLLKGEEPSPPIHPCSCAPVNALTGYLDRRNTAGSSWTFRTRDWEVQRIYCATC